MIHNLIFNRKSALTFVALLAAFSTFSNTASAASCSINCLRVYSMTLSDLGNTIGGIVKLTDETGSGGGARSTVVHGLWTRPDGSVLDQYAVIGTRLRAQFSLYTAATPGTYTLTVVDATKAGYTFDSKNSSVLSTSITVGEAQNQPPIAISNADVVSGSAPLMVTFDSIGSTDPDGAILSYAWDFGDGDSSTEETIIHTYTSVGSFTASMTVTDNLGATASSSNTITVTESNAGCISNCMSVDNIALSYKSKKGKIKGLVSLFDENDDPVGSAEVHARWTLPDGSTVDQTRNVRANLKARFTLKATAVGRYTLSVVEVIEQGHTFDADASNVLTGSIDIAP